MKKPFILLLAAVLIFASIPDISGAQESLDRIRAAEAFFYLVEARFPNVFMPRRNLRDACTVKMPFDAHLIQLAAGSVSRSDNLRQTTLWVNKNFRRVIDKWDRFGGRIEKGRIVVYEDLNMLIENFNPGEDLVIMHQEDLRILTTGFSDGKRVALEEAVILSPMNLHLEYMDQFLVALFLMRELKDSLRTHDPHIVKASSQFMALRILLESLIGGAIGLRDNDILNMIPQGDIPFELRMLTIQQNSMSPIRREDMERIRKVQSTFRSV